MSHSHVHNHSHSHDGSLVKALIVTLALVLIKIAGAYWGHSLALGADAAHSLGDVGSLGLAVYADRQSRRPPSPRFSFGWGRIEILAGLVNALLLWILAGGMIWEAINQWSMPIRANSAIMAIFATLALLINGILAWDFREAKDYNHKSTLLHLLADAAGSLGVLIGAIALQFTGWSPINPLVTILIAILMLWGSWNIIRDTVLILLEATPHTLPLVEITRSMETVLGVDHVHDLHVWIVGSKQPALACHIALDINAPPPQEILCNLHELLICYGIDHSTIQFETPDEIHDEPSW